MPKSAAMHQTMLLVPDAGAFGHSARCVTPRSENQLYGVRSVTSAAISSINGEYVDKGYFRSVQGALQGDNAEWRIWRVRRGSRTCKPEIPAQRSTLSSH